MLTINFSYTCIYILHSMTHILYTIIAAIISTTAAMITRIKTAPIAMIVPLDVSVSNIFYDAVNVLIKN